MERKSCMEDSEYEVYVGRLPHVLMVLRVPIIFCGHTFAGINHNESPIDIDAEASKTVGGNIFPFMHDFC